MTIIERSADVSKIIDAVERDRRAAIIEECAKVADNGIELEMTYTDIATAIRALKDKP